MKALTPEKERRIIFCAAAAAIVALQWLAFSFQILEIHPETYATYAVELEAGANWRYGYVTSWHGAILVKTPNLGRGGPESPVDPEYEPDREIEQIMRRELEALPRKALLELLLYLACLAYACFGMGPMRRTLQGANPGRLRGAAAEALVWVSLWYILAMPLILWGYGTPLFTNCLGPGALSWSGPWYGPTPAPYTFTVTYRYLMVGLTWGPSMRFCLAGVSLFIAKLIPEASEGMTVWLSGLLFSSILGTIRGAARTLLQAEEVIDSFPGIRSEDDSLPC